MLYVSLCVWRCIQIASQHCKAYGLKLWWGAAKIWLLLSWTMITILLNRILSCTLCRLGNWGYTIHHRIPGWTHHSATLVCSLTVWCLDFSTWATCNAEKNNYLVFSWHKIGLLKYFHLLNCCPLDALYSLVPRLSSKRVTRSTTSCQYWVTGTHVDRIFFSVWSLKPGMRPPSI